MNTLRTRLVATGYAPSPLRERAEPDAANHDPRPEYLRALIAEAGLTQREAARRIGITDRALRYYLATPGGSAEWRVAPYTVQYALEQMAKAGQR